jgi:zona occludens toxin
MAISYIVGIPRSGKSYLAVYMLWKKFVYAPKDTFLTRIIKKFKKPIEEKNYEVAYTNINQFDFTKNEKIVPLDFFDLKSKLSELHKLYKEHVTDYELIEKAKEMKIYKAFFVIDECHNYFKNKDDEVLVWWLTYHGHLYQDIWLITQDLSLVSNEYKRIAEFFYKAVPPAQRLNTSRFRYVQFSNYRMHLNGVIKGGGYNLPALQEVFNMYVSGDKNNTKSFIQKYLIFAFALSLLLIPLMFVFMSNFKSENTPIKQDNQTNTDNQINTDFKQSNPTPNIKNVNDKPIKTDEIEQFYYEIYCIDTFCKYKDIEFPISLFNYIVTDNAPLFQYVYLNNNTQTYYLLFDKEVFKFLKNGGNKNEKSRKDYTNPISNFNIM